MLHRQSSIFVKILEEKGNNVVWWNNYWQHYTPLELFAVNSRLLYITEDTIHAVYELEIVLQSNNPNALRAELAVSTALNSMFFTSSGSFVNINTAEQYCTRYSLTADDTEYQETLTLEHDVKHTWRTRWQVSSAAKNLFVRINFRQAAASGSGAWVSSMDILRNVQKYNAVCNAPHTDNVVFDHHIVANVLV